MQDTSECGDAPSRSTNQSARWHESSACPPANDLQVTGAWRNSGHKMCTQSMELRHLVYFVVAAEHGSFRKTGVVLEINASAVSRRIRHLEDKLGASLFHRHSGGVRLTHAGEQFLVSARNALRTIDEGARDIAAIGRCDEGSVKIGVFSSLGTGFLSDLLETFERKHPAIGIEFIEGDQAEHLAAIRKLELDVAFITGTEERADCDTEPLWSERIFVALPDNHALAGRVELGWSDLATERFIVSEMAPGQAIHDYLIRRLAHLGHHPEIKQHRVGRFNLLSMVALGRGLTLASEAVTSASFAGVVFRRVINEQLPFSAIWSPNNDNPACRRLLSLARSMAKRRADTEATDLAATDLSDGAPSQSPDRSQ